MRHGSVTNVTMKACPHCKHPKAFEYSESTSRKETPCTSINKRGRWKIIEAIQQQSADLQNKNAITVKSSKRYLQYKYKYRWGTHKPTHPFFPHNRPHFIYKPNVKCAKLNSDEFMLAWEQGSKYFYHVSEDALFDVEDSTRKTLVYLTGNRPQEKHKNCDIHANGGSFASWVDDYDKMVFGPIVQGQTKKDKSIHEVVYMHIKAETSNYCYCKVKNMKYEQYKIDRKNGSDQRRKDQQIRKVGMNKDIFSYIDSNRY
jgi:hypothetical protein